MMALLKKTIAGASRHEKMHDITRAYTVWWLSSSSLKSFIIRVTIVNRKIVQVAK